MPRKSHRRFLRFETTRNVTNGADDGASHKCKQNIRFTNKRVTKTKQKAIAQMETSSTPSNTGSSQEAPSTTKVPTISPSSKGKLPSKRRKREPIKLPPDLSVDKLSATDLRRLKNRIAATRLRQRSQQSVRSMQEQLESYRSRCEFLEIVMSECATCCSAVDIDDIDLLPAESKKVKLKNETVGTTNLLTEDECHVLAEVLEI